MTAKEKFDQLMIAECIFPKSGIKYLIGRREFSPSIAFRLFEFQDRDALSLNMDSMFFYDKITGTFYNVYNSKFIKMKTPLTDTWQIIHDFLLYPISFSHAIKTIKKQHFPILRWNRNISFSQEEWKTLELINEMI